MIHSKITLRGGIKVEEFIKPATSEPVIQNISQPSQPAPDRFSQPTAKMAQHKTQAQIDAELEGMLSEHKATIKVVGSIGTLIGSSASW